MVRMTGVPIFLTRMGWKECRKSASLPFVAFSAVAFHSSFPSPCSSDSSFSGKVTISRLAS